MKITIVGHFSESDNLKVWEGDGRCINMDLKNIFGNGGGMYMELAQWLNFQVLDIFKRRVVLPKGF
jgi:hypothetical protein